MKTIVTAVLLFLWVTSFQQVKAGWYITEQSKDRFGNQSFNTTFIQDSIIRFDRPTSISIINLHSKTITLIFAQHRAYWRGTVEDLTQTTSQMALEQLTKLLAYAPEQKKAAIEKAINSFKKNRLQPDSLRTFSTVKVVNTGLTDTVSGYPAQRFKIIIDSVLKQVVWVTSKIKPYHDTDIDKIMAFSRAMSPFAIENSLSHSTGYMKLLHSGYILKSINYTSDGNKIVTTVTQIKKTHIPEALFQVPPGYVQSSLQNMMMLDMENNVLNPKNIAPDNDNPGGLPPPLPDKGNTPNLNLNHL